MHATLLSLKPYTTNIVFIPPPCKWEVEFVRLLIIGTLTWNRMYAIWANKIYRKALMCIQYVVEL